MPRQINHGEYAKIDIRLPDGSIRQGEVGADGHLYLYDERGNSTAPQPQQAPPQQGNSADGEGLKDFRNNYIPDPNIAKDATFRSRLASTLKDNAFDRVVKGRKRGKLDLTSLPKAAMGSNSIFAQKSARKGKAYNVVLVIDESGSMSNGRIQQAALTAAFLADNFMDINLELAVVGFANYTQVRKSFDQSMTALHLYRKVLHEFMGGGTDDIEGLRTAYKMLKGKEGESNIVIILTDGEGAPREEMHTLVNAHANLCKTYGIGIGTPAAQIPNNVMAKTLDELKPLVLNIMKQSVQRG